MLQLRSRSNNGVALNRTWQDWYGTGSGERPEHRSIGLLIDAQVAPRSPYRTASCPALLRSVSKCVYGTPGASCFVSSRACVGFNGGGINPFGACAAAG